MNQSLERPSFLRSNKGFGLIEVMIAFGLMAILTAVMTSLFDTVFKQQKQANVASTLTTMRETIMKTIADGRAWNNTIAEPINGAVINNCLNLRDGSCPHTVLPSPKPNPLVNTWIDDPAFIDLPVLRDAGNPSAIVFNSSIVTNGFTDRGAPCVNFDMVNGNDTCPIRWETKLQYICPGGAGPCLDPAIQVYAYLYYRPAANNPMRAVINENRFTIDMTRGARGENRSERFEAAKITVAANSGGGICNPGTWNAVSWVGGDVSVNEPIAPATPNATVAGGPAINLAAGTYVCSASSTCFDCGVIRIKFQLNGADVQNGASNSILVAPWTLGQASIGSVNMINNGAGTLQLFQWCQSAPAGGDPAFAQYGLGMALPPYTADPGTKMTTISCTRIF